MSGRIHAKVLNTGREAKNNTAKPLEYIVTKKWDAYTDEKKSNVDASDVSEQVELMNSRPVSGFDTLKNGPIIPHDSCDESNSIISCSSSSVFSGMTAEAKDRACRAPFGLEKKWMRLFDGMPCTKIEDIDDNSDEDSHSKERRMWLCTSMAKNVDGLKACKSDDFSRATFESKSHDFSRGTSRGTSRSTWDSQGTFDSKSHDFSRGTWDSDTCEDSLGKDSASKEDLLEEDKLHVQEPSNVELADGISASKKRVLKPKEIGVWLTGGIQKTGKNTASKKRVLKPKEIGVWLTGGIQKTGKNILLIDEDVEGGDLVEEDSPQTAEKSALLVSKDAAFEKVDEDIEKGEEFPGIEYTLSLVERNAKWDDVELLVNDANGIEVIKVHPKEPLKGAATSTSPGVDSSILGPTCSQTESEDSLADGIHVTDEIISGTSGSRASERQLFKDDESFVAPALEYTLSTLKKHKVNAEAAAKSTEIETCEAVEDVVLASMNVSARNGDDEDDLDFPSIEYALSFGEKFDFDESRAVEPASATKTVGDNIAELPGIEYTLSVHENVASTESNTSAPITVTKLNMNGVSLAGSQIKDCSPIPGKRETDADQASPIQDAPVSIDQPDSHSVLPVVASMPDSCNTGGYKHRRAFWRKSKRLAAAAAGKSAEETTKATGEKSAVGPPAGEESGSVEKQKWTDSVAPKQERPFGVASAKSVERTMKATVPLTKSKMTFDKSEGKASSDVEKYPSPIPGKSERHAGQISTNGDAPCVVEQPELKKILPIDAAMAGSRKGALRKYRQSLWGRSKRPSSAANTAERITKANNHKGAVGPPAGEGSMSLNDGSAEKQKWTGLVASKEARPYAVASAKSVEGTMIANNDKSAATPLVGEDPASLNDESLEEQKSNDSTTPERRSSAVAAAKSAETTMKESDVKSAVEPPVFNEVPALLNDGSLEEPKSTDSTTPEGRSSVVAAAKSAGKTMTESDDKSAVEPSVNELPASLNDGSSEKEKSTDLVVPNQARPFAVAEATSVESITKATDKSAVKPLVGEVPGSLIDGSSEEQKSTDPVTPERKPPEQSTFGLIHASSSPTSVVDANFAKSERDTKASTNTEATNEPEANNKTSEPGIDTDKASRDEGATDAQEPVCDTSEPCKGFTNGNTEANGEKTLTNKDEANEKEPKIETSELRIELGPCTRGRTHSLIRGRRSLSLGRRRSEPASLSTHTIDNRRFPWFSARKEQATEAHDGAKQGEKEEEYKAVPSRRQKKTFIMMRKKERKQHAYEQLEDDEDDETANFYSYGHDKFCDCSAFPIFTPE